MNRNKLRKLKNEIQSYQGRGGIKSSEMESIAARLGRYKSKKGDEPAWVSEPFPDLQPVSIPHHSTDLNRFTAGGILDQLELDIERWEEKIKYEE